MANKHVDVVTVGAGWTAGVLAEQLTRAGLTVVSLERGEIRDTALNFSHDHDELRYQVRRDMMINLQNETWTWRPGPKDTALPMRQYGSFNPGRGTGAPECTGPPSTGASTRPTFNTAPTTSSATEKRSFPWETGSRIGR